MYALNVKRSIRDDLTEVGGPMGSDRIIIHEP